MAPAPAPAAAPEHRRWRRLHGLQPPLHPQQLAGWLVLVLFAAAVFLVLVPALGDPLRPLLFSVLAGLFLLHTAAHLAALLLDPADGPLRRLRASTLVPEFDRSKHAHVIENGRCHLCNIETSGPRTKHCSVCNKCVARFDHHCKWLNHCIGGRNYVAFLVAVVSAVAAAVTVVGVSVTELVLYHVDRAWLNLPDRPALDTAPDTTFDPADLQLPLHDQVFLFVVSSAGVLAGVTAALLLHLCLFHVYISFLGVTTYEYIRNYRQMSTAAAPSTSQSESESIKKLGARPSSRASRESFLKNSDSNCSFRETQSNTSVEFRPVAASRPVRSKPASSCRWTCCSESQELNLESFREKDNTLGTPSFPRIPSLEKRCSVETVEAVSRRRYCCPSRRQPPAKKGSCKGCPRCKAVKAEVDIEPPAVKKTIGQRTRRPQRLSSFVVRRFLNRLVSRSSEAAVTSPVKRNQIRPSECDRVPPPPPPGPGRSASLPALPPPTRRHIQTVSLKELGDVLSYVQQPRRPSLRRHPLRRKSIPSLRPTMSPSLSPIHESGLSNPSTPRPGPRPHSWLAVNSHI